MSVDIILTNAKIYFRGTILRAGLAIDEGRIFRIAKETNLPPASTKLDLKGQIVLPGLIDSHVHLRDQQLAYKEDFRSGTMAAAKGGITLILDMPNNKPVTMDLHSLKERMKLAEREATVNIGFYSAFPEDLNQIPAIVRAGVVAFKLYLSANIGGLNIDDDIALLRAFNKAAETGIPIAVHAEDREMLEETKRKMEMAERNDLLAYIETHSVQAEKKAIERVIRIARKSRAHIHFCHISSDLGLKSVLKAKSSGLNVTCEVTPHHLLLSKENIREYGTLALSDPPVRSVYDTKCLWKALKDGSIDNLASDHAPHTIGEKKARVVWNIKPGLPGLETMLPLMLNQVNRGQITISDLVRVTSEKPAEIFNIKGRGCLSNGNHADIVVVDITRGHRIDASNFISKAKHSPFDNWKVKGIPTKTFVNGHLVMNDNEVIANVNAGEIIGSRS